MGSDAAERLFSQVFHNLTQRQADITTLRRLPELGVPAATKTLSRENYHFALSMQSNPAFDIYFMDRKAAVAFLGGPEAIGSTINHAAAVIMIVCGYWFCIKGSRVKLSVCGDYRMDIIVSIILLAFIALLVYTSIDATKHPK